MEIHHEINHEINYKDLLYQLNCLASDLDALYHQAAVKLGLSDSAMFVLYLVYENDGSYLLNKIRQESGMSKQTLNSAIRKLEQENIIYLEQVDGRSKNVYLTEEGKKYAANTVEKLYDAESRAFDKWTDDEIKQHLKLMKKYNDSFRTQLETL